VADYAEYLRNSGISRTQANTEMFQGVLAKIMQDKKNQSAPVISGGGASVRGGGGGVAGGGSYSGPLSFKGLAKGKALPTGARVSQGWGKSRIKYAAGRHTGVDFGGAANSPIKAAASGVVVRAGGEGAYGNAIHVRQKDGTTALYAHLNGVNVKPGQRVNIGQTIGKMGATGRAFGTHLHFEIRKQDRYGGDINPYSWFSTR